MFPVWTVQKNIPFYLVPRPDLSQHVVVSPLEVVSDLELVPLGGDFGLDLAIGVVDDGLDGWDKKVKGPFLNNSAVIYQEHV